ncbi:MAG: ribulose-phosphate 3-epimerase [Planctomycetota bacterium]|jgi:ribulose-phosphate 3-epimerase|nr:ribulose-phosphate 3-epimerase [Planctomycetota bacterium]
MRKVLISPSMMCADFLALRGDLDVMAKEGVELLHIDVMDGHYVPNFTLGPDYCRALAADGRIPLDIHLMIENVDAFVERFSGFPGGYLSFHPETQYHPQRTLQLIAQHGMLPGIGVAPSYSVARAKPLLPYVRLVCVMTVNPGYAGQKLIPEAMDKIGELRDYREKAGLDFLVEVDGNVSWENIPKMVKAGADALVAGTSSLFRKDEALADNIKRMREAIAESL